MTRAPDTSDTLTRACVSLLVAPKKARGPRHFPYFSPLKRAAGRQVSELVHQKKRRGEGGNGENLGQHGPIPRYAHPKVRCSGPIAAVTDTLTRSRRCQEWRAAHQ